MYYHKIRATIVICFFIYLPYGSSGWISMLRRIPCLVDTVTDIRWRGNKMDVEQSSSKLQAGGCAEDPEHRQSHVNLKFSKNQAHQAHLDQVLFPTQVSPVLLYSRIFRAFILTSGLPFDKLSGRSRSTPPEVKTKDMAWALNSKTSSAGRNTNSLSRKRSLRFIFCATPGCFLHLVEHSSKNISKFKYQIDQKTWFHYIIT